MTDPSKAPTKRWICSGCGTENPLHDWPCSSCGKTDWKAIRGYVIYILCLGTGAAVGFAIVYWTWGWQAPLPPIMVPVVILIIIAGIMGVINLVILGLKLFRYIK